MKSRISTFLLIGFGLFTLVGCGISRGDVSGTVTFKEKSVKVGQVMMIGHDSLPLYGEIGSDGKYEIKGVPTGDVKVVVSSPDPALAGKGAREREKVGKKGGDGGGRDNEAPKGGDNKDWFALPAKYADVTKPAITTKLTSGKNTFDIKLD